jgi:hypothetical protein
MLSMDQRYVNGHRGQTLVAQSQSDEDVCLIPFILFIPSPHIQKETG